MANEQERERRLLEAVGAIAADLQLAQALERIVAAACWIADARYGALGVLGDRRLLTEFVHEGLDDETVAAIGRLPEGHGVLGVLIDEPRPLRLRELAKHAASVGFPPNHPPMHSFLGVPITVRGAVFGNLYLCEKRSGDEFTESDEQLVLALAAAAGATIANARLYDEVQQREQSLAALQGISTALLGGAKPDDVLDLVAAHAREIVDANAAAIVLRGDTADDLVVESAAGDGRREVAALTIPEASIAGDVLRGRRSVALEDASQEPQAYPSFVDALRCGPALFVPLPSQAEPFGVLVVARHKGRQPFSSADAQLVQSFAAQASLALGYARNLQELHRLTVLEDEQRIARDLHDSVIQDIFAIGLSVQATALRVNDAEIEARLQKAVEDLDGTIRGIRRAIFGLRGGLVAAGGVREEVRSVLTELATAHGLQHNLFVEGIVDGRVDGELRAHMVAVVREAVSNAGRHAKAHKINVYLDATAEELSVRIVDDGEGIPSVIGRRSGLANMDERARRLGGAFSVAPGARGGTEVVWRVPLGG